jgi:hypothetical protein
MVIFIEDAFGSISPIRHAIEGMTAICAIG